jgi:hypothetical protein
MGKPATDGNVRPYRPRSFSNLSQAEEENGQSRVYLGIHWAFDKKESPLVAVSPITFSITPSRLLILNLKLA